MDLLCVFFPKGIEVEYLRIWIVKLKYVCIIIIPSEKSDEDKTKFISFWPYQILQELNQLHPKLPENTNWSGSWVPHMTQRDSTPRWYKHQNSTALHL